MPVCAFEAGLTAPAVRVNGTAGGLVLAKSGTVNNSTACDFVLLTNAEYDQIYHAVLVANPSADPAAFDYEYAGGLWALALATVVGLYCVSTGFGSVLGMIRRG